MFDRSAVKSSVRPSAKYCWSRSSLRLVNGSTTIERRGAVAGIAGADADAVTAGDDQYAGQSCGGDILAGGMPCSQPGRLWNIRFGQGGNGFRRQRIDADRAGDVFDALLTAILEGESQAVADLLAHRPRDADTARLGQAFQARCDIHRIAEQI